MINYFLIKLISFFKQIKKDISLKKIWVLKKITFHFLYWKYDVLERYLESKMHNIYFVQIGSNDGVANDFLCEKILKYKYRGILIEPVPYLFKKLLKNYENNSKNLIFENLAIGNKSGVLPFYRLDVRNSEGKTLWYEGLGSFKKEILMKHKNAVPNFKELLISELIELITFQDLIQKHKIVKLDLLQIDTEGYEFEIISSIDFSRIDIDVILFEHKHLSKFERNSIVKILNLNDYLLKKYTDFDTLAIKKLSLPI